MCWSHAVGPSGHVTTLEFSSEYALTAEEAFAKNNIQNIKVLVGDAKDSYVFLPVHFYFPFNWSCDEMATKMLILKYSLKIIANDLDEPFDLVFIDADKVSYPTYLSLILSLSSPSSTTTRILRPGGIILADNILRRGLIADSSSANPWSTRMKEEGRWREEDMKALDEFNKALVGSERIETFLMPMFDGLGCGRLID